jgi:WD40 repeat protein
MNHLMLALLLCCSFSNVWAQSYIVDKTLSGHQGPVQNLRFSPDGKYLATAGLQDNQVVLWEVATGKLMRKFHGHSGAIYEVSFSHNGRLLASASKDGTAQVWDVSTGNLVSKFENEPMMSPSGMPYKSLVFVCFTNDDKTLFFGGDNGYLCKGNIGTQHTYRVTQMNTHDPAYIKTLTGGAITPDGRGVMVSIDNFVRVVDINTGQIVKTFFYPYDYINDVVAGPGNRITTWSYDGKVTIWDYQEERILQSIQVTAPKNYSVASFSHDGAKMATGAFGASARVWDWRSENSMATLGGHKLIVRIARFSPVEDMIATASYDGTVRIWKPSKEVPAPVVAANGGEAKPKPAPVPSENTSKKDPAPASTAISPSVVGQKIAVGKVINLKHIQFEQGKYELAEDAKTELNAVLILLKKMPTMEIEIHGHTDNIGNAESNHRLSERRAIVSKNYLVEQGIEESRIRIRAFGGDQPIADNSSEETRKLNRRIEMKIVKL